MRPKTTMHLLAIILVAAFTIVTVSSMDTDVSADDQQEYSTIYAHSDKANVIYTPGPNENVHIEWYVDGVLLTEGYGRDYFKQTIDISDMDLSGSRMVRQVVTDTEGHVTEVTVAVKHVEITDPSGAYKVKFYNGSELVSESVINTDTIVYDHERFFDVPMDPQTDDYEFDGWYTGDTFYDSEKVDVLKRCYEPVTGNITFYSKFLQSNSISLKEIENNGHSVRFNLSPTNI